MDMLPIVMVTITAIRKIRLIVLAVAMKDGPFRYKNFVPSIGRGATTQTEEQPQARTAMWIFDMGGNYFSLRR